MREEPGETRVMIDARYIREQTSGIGRYTENIISQMLELRPEMSLSLITHPSRPAPFEHERVSCQVFDAPPNSPSTRFRISRKLDMEGVDLFHSSFNFLPGKLPVPAVFTLHDIMWLLDPSYCTQSRLRQVVSGTFYGQFIPRSVREAVQIMTVSHSSREAIEEHFPEVKGRVHVTYNGLDPFFHELPEEEAWAQISRYIPPRRRFVLVVGQGSPYKNHAGALAGFIEAFRDDPQMYIVLVRRFERGGDSELEELMQDPSLNSRLINLSYVSGEELRALYNAAFCFLFPSIYEGFGLPALEAMACGTPVVTSDSGAPAEVCGDGAVKVDPRDVSSIARALRALADDEEHWREVAAAGKKRAAEFTWRRSAEQVLSVYDRALAVARAAREAKG